MQRGRLVRLWRHPVKSMAGEPVEDARVDARGMVGDRRHAVFPAGGRADARPLTARETPRMLAWSAGYPSWPGALLCADGVVPAPTLTAPDGRQLRWDEPALQPALERDLGLPVRLVADPEPVHDVPRTLLVTTEASRRALEAELGAPVDVRRFRSNVHLDLGGEWSDLEWSGGLLRVGDVALRLVEPCRRCVIPARDLITLRKWPELLQHLAREHELGFGVYARVVAPGTIRVGDPVELELERGDDAGAHAA